MRKNLSIVGSTETIQSPPRNLGTSGRELWQSIMSEYDISDSGGREILAQVCMSADRAAALAAQINIDGPVILVRGALRDHPALKHELAARAFICRNLQRLGLNVEAIKPVGRPPIL